MARTTFPRRHRSLALCLSRDTRHTCYPWSKLYKLESEEAGGSQVVPDPAVAAVVTRRSSAFAERKMGDSP
ncbi:hypothetical protein ACFX2F_003952 [Malus domestica]